MANSLRAKLSKLKHDGNITDAEYQKLIAKLDGHDKEIRNKAIDTFSEKLEAELLDAKRVLSERREMQERESEMAKICSYNIGVLNAVGSMVGEVAEQLKEESNGHKLTTM